MDKQIIFTGHVTKEERTLRYTFGHVKGTTYFELEFLEMQDAQREYTETAHVHAPSKEIEYTIERNLQKDAPNYQNDDVWNDLIDLMKRTKGADYVKHNSKRIDILKTELKAVDTLRKETVQEFQGIRTTKVFAKLLPGQVKQFAQNYVNNSKI